MPGGRGARSVDLERSNEMTTFITGWNDSSAAEAAARFSEGLAGALGADVARVTIEEGSVAQGLQEAATARDAALIAVGGTHHGAVGRILVGSVGEKLLHGSPCPVVVVPAETADHDIATVGVAYDGRPEARAALLAGKALADRLEARLVVLAVNEPVLLPYAGYGVPPAYGDLDLELADEYGEEMRAQVAELAGEGIEVRVFVGPAIPRLTEAAGDGIDLLVTGSRGYGAVRGVLLGSVSRHLVDHAPCPVLVLPRGATADVLVAPAAATAAS
jgi:nucleotide-binding universal stress UspA family protein